RLSEQGLLAIRPQRPTIVRHFSLTEIRNARFIRAGVELEVLKKACVDRDAALDAPLDACMADQEAALAANDVDAFHAHDYQFHKLLCEAAGAGFAFKVIADSKALVDRLCMLSLTSQSAVEVLYEDHLEILDAVRRGQPERMEPALRRHLDRLSATIDAVHDTHPEYFE
ncbi:MAG: GntR family transcriptional regulator, partial [Ruegeria sp.]